MYTAFFDATEPVSMEKIPHNGSAPGVAWVAVDNLGEASANVIKDLIKNPQMRGTSTKSYF